MALSASICFSSERFDYASELPEEFNAGNRFYGKDVADSLASHLTAQGHSCDYLDEDWGWLVLSIKESTSEFEVAIYNLAEHGEGGRPGIGEWGLWLRAYERKKVFGFIPKRSEIQVPAPLLAALESAVRAVGAEPRAWKEGPSAA